MDKSYVVTFKGGKSQIVKGSIVFFSIMHTCVPISGKMVYLNADEVLSVVEREES
jgi:hypothetical protein